MTRTTPATCMLCEATCGVVVETDGNQVVTVRGDKDDPFSRGYICPKAHGLKALQDDPDRLRAPIKRTDSGWQEISWDEALSMALDGLQKVIDEHGKNGVGTYLGNPITHNLHTLLGGPVLLRALGTRQRYSANSVDTLSKLVATSLMFGSGLAIPIPDIDRTDYMLILGGNPRVSNGSLMTAPDVGKRLDAIVERGGKVVVFDPRRSETADAASEHHFVRPDTDAALLLAMVHVMFADDLVDLGRAAEISDGLDEVRACVKDLTPQSVADHCGISADDIRRITHEFCAAKSAVCYGRLGTTCQSFGTVSSWAVDLVNILSGNIDRAGGAMFTTPAADINTSVNSMGGKNKIGRSRSRVKGLPEAFGEYPAVTLADEILTPGDGQIRAMVTLAGNPVLSVPNGGKLDRAFADLEFMVAVDFYVNETTRHANVILPPPAPLERDHYDLLFSQLAIRNVAKYVPAVVSRPDGQPTEWEILLTLAKGMMGMKDAPLAMADEFVLMQVMQAELGHGCRFPNLDLQEVKTALGDEPGPRRILDLMLRVGPHGDGFGKKPGGLSLATLEAAPHGIDLGALEARLPELLPTGRIDLAPPLITAELKRLRRVIASARTESALVLIGRRHLRSNNSWMHNLTALVKGPDRCTLLVHPNDAQRLQLDNGSRAHVSSAVGELVASVAVSDEMMPGVVSLPHGWGHANKHTRLGVANQHAGVNVNLLSDDALIDPVCGNAALNGVPVTVRRLLV